jgi:hypothetical protein
VKQALNLLETDSLYRSEKCLGVARWFYDLHIKRSSAENSRAKENMVWYAVATAPVGYCHIKSTMIGTLLDDIVAVLPFETISRKFAEKMHPLQYQRPQAAPPSGNITRAEDIVEKLGIRKSLDRRFARVEELEKIWTPKEKKEQASGSGVFSHLIPKDSKKADIPDMNIPAITMTWRKFSETVLPKAESIEYYAPAHSECYSAITTAADMEAPPILQWDKEDRRNPFSWYLYNGGSSYHDWNLHTGYCKVTGICLQPSMWYGGNNSHISEGVFLILEGAKDTRYKTAGNALFPETLKSELREIRSTIEAYSKDAVLGGYDDSSACGIRLGSKYPSDIMLRVTTSTGAATYKIDRWD